MLFTPCCPSRSHPTNSIACRVDRVGQLPRRATGLGSCRAEQGRLDHGWLRDCARLQHRRQGRRAALCAVKQPSAEQDSQSLAHNRLARNSLCVRAHHVAAGQGKHEMEKVGAVRQLVIVTGACGKIKRSAGGSSAHGRVAKLQRWQVMVQMEVY